MKIFFPTAFFAVIGATLLFQTSAIATPDPVNSTSFSVVKAHDLFDAQATVSEHKFHKFLAEMPYGTGKTETEQVAEDYAYLGYDGDEPCALCH